MQLLSSFYKLNKFEQQFQPVPSRSRKGQISYKHYASGKIFSDIFISQSGGAEVDPLFEFETSFVGVNLNNTDEVQISSIFANLNNTLSEIRVDNIVQLNLIKKLFLNIYKEKKEKDNFLWKTLEVYQHVGTVLRILNILLLFSEFKTILSNLYLNNIEEKLDALLIKIKVFFIKLNGSDKDIDYELNIIETIYLDIETQIGPTKILLMEKDLFKHVSSIFDEISKIIHMHQSMFCLTDEGQSFLKLDGMSNSDLGQLILIATAGMKNVLGSRMKVKNTLQHVTSPSDPFYDSLDPIVLEQFIRMSKNTKHLFDEACSKKLLKHFEYKIGRNGRLALADSNDNLDFLEYDEPGDLSNFLRYVLGLYPRPDKNLHKMLSEYETYWKMILDKKYLIK